MEQTVQLSSPALKERTRQRLKMGRMGGPPLIDEIALLAQYRRFSEDRDIKSFELRAELLEHTKSVIADARVEARRRLEAGEADGIGTAKLLGLAMDAVIRALAEYCTSSLYRVENPTKAERLGIMAVGGYGRGTLAPHSDLDLLFLLPYKETAWSESVCEWLLYMLWDLGLKVGHATRSVPECVRQARGDVTIATAMLEARPLWGDLILMDEFHTAYWQEVVHKSDAADFVEAKLAERDDRHKKMGDSRYRVEPNLKEGKGGLRDLQTLYWIGKYAYEVEEVSDLVEKGVLTKTEARAFAKAEAFLMTVRCHLHFLTDRPEERITFDVQPALAELLGYHDREGVRGVERFMRHYFLYAKEVGDLTRIFCAVLEEHSHKSRIPSFGSILPRLTGRWTKQIGDFTTLQGRITVADDEAFKRDPANLLRLFREADKHGFDIHPDALQLVTRSLRLIDKDLRENEDANRIFLEMLTSKHTPEITLRRLNEAGVFGRFMPEFGRVVALMQFNMYHHYTVDEHSIRAVGILAAIERGERADDHPLGTKLMAEVGSRRALYVAMLLHDIAKGLPGDHSEVGADIALEVCPRLGLTGEETETVAWLVRMHLVMSNVAQKRDVSDPRTVETFAEIVQSPERLRLLHCLTESDMNATANGVWNGWKAQLMRELYEATLDKLTGGQSAGARRDRIERAKEALAAELTEWKKAELKKLMDRHYDPYWVATDLETQLRHARLLKKFDKGDGALVVDWEVRKDRDVTEVTLILPDHPGIFARVSGALSLAGANIVDAKGFTTTDGYAIEVFSIQNSERKAFTDESRLKKLPKRIEKTLKGGVQLPEEFDAKGRVPKRLRPFTVEPRVLVLNSASDTYTVIEVNGRDRLGLLYDLGRALYALNLTIGSAHISTYGERVIDVFYVKDLFGHQITQAERIKTLQARLSAVLEPGYRDEDAA